MSDFIYSQSNKYEGLLTSLLKSIYTNCAQECFEFHGKWGSLCVMANHYPGFNHYEDEDYIVAVIGGPQLKFPVSSTSAIPENVGTTAILERWKYQKDIEWDADLSGPFVVLCIDKREQKLEIVTDMMSFVQVYGVYNSNACILSTHVDLLAKLANLRSCLDQTSIADFLLSGFVTYPYTFYDSVRQLSPGSIFVVRNNIDINQTCYWVPTEHEDYPSLKKASLTLRTSLQSSVTRICEDCDDVAILLSGGEDSRVVLALIPDATHKTAYVFVDSENRESKIARRIADIYSAKFVEACRSPTHYLEQLEDCSRLVGSQTFFLHVHAFQFHQKFRLLNYGAVLGGLFSDTLLKGFFSQHPRKTPRNPPHFQKEILQKVLSRKNDHKNQVKKFRPESAAEWAMVWPISHNQDSAFYTGHRRLFRSYEPFMDSDVVKIAASVPQNWKINRRLFQSATKPFLRPSWAVPHVSGHFPYYGAYSNIPLKIFVGACRKIDMFSRKSTINQSPWPDWDQLIETNFMLEMKNTLEPYYEMIQPVFGGARYSTLFNTTPLRPLLQLKLMHVLSTLKAQEK